jgi:hypothetical protein
MPPEITAFLEVKHGGDWYQYSEVLIEHDTLLYSKMTDLPGLQNNQPISAPKGLPANVSCITAMMLDQSYIEAASWLDSDELDELSEYMTQYCEHSLAYTIDEWSELLINVYKFEDYRLVFGFYC